MFRPAVYVSGAGVGLVDVGIEGVDAHEEAGYVLGHFFSHRSLPLILEAGLELFAEAQEERASVRLAVERGARHFLRSRCRRQRRVFAGDELVREAERPVIVVDVDAAQRFFTPLPCKVFAASVVYRFLLAPIASDADLELA